MIDNIIYMAGERYLYMNKTRRDKIKFVSVLLITKDGEAINEKSNPSVMLGRME